MFNKIKKALVYHVVAVAVALQLVALVNYWYLVYKNIALASINSTIAYQGKVVNADSLSIADGNYDMTFRVYDSSDTGTGVLLWEEKWDGTDQDTITGGTQGSQVAIEGGLFTVDLNSLCSNWTSGTCAKLAGGVDFNTNSLYLEVRLDADNNNGTGSEGFEEVFLPRKRFSSIAYSMNADKVDGYDIGTSGDAIPLLSASNTWTGAQTIAISSAATKGIVIQGAASQSANLMEFQISDTSVITSINSSGYIETTNINSSKITTDTTGVGSAPATTGSNAYYALDAGTGTTTVDTSGNSNTGTLVNNTSWVTGKFGYIGDYALNFDGVDDYVTVPDHNSLSFGNSTTDSPFSLELWFYPDTAQGGGIFGKWDETAGLREWLLYCSVTGGNLYPRLILLDESTNAYKERYQTTASVSPGSWHHLVVTYDGTAGTTGMKMYINGALTTTTSNVSGVYTAMENLTTPVTYGAYKAAASAYSEIDGKLDNVAVYNSELSAATILTHYQAGLNTGYGMTVDSGAAYSGSELLAIKNNGTTVASFDATGVLTSDGVTSTGQILASPSSDIVPFKVNASSSQTANLTEWKNSSDTVVASVDKNGNVEFPTVTATNVITPTVTSDTLPSATEPTVGDSGQISYWKADDNGIFPQDTTDTNLIAWYKMQTGSGTTLTDNEGNTTGTITAATWAGSGAFTDSTNSLSFDGTGDYVSMSDFTPLEGLSSFTVNMWVKQTTSNQDRVMFEKYFSSTSRIGMYTWSDGRIYLELGNGSDAFGYLPSYSSVLTAGTWHNITYVFNGSATGNANRLKLYINGVQQTLTFTGTIPATSPSNTGVFYIGRYSAAFTARDWLGGIDNIAIYNDVRTDAEIVRDYRKTQSTYIADYLGTNHSQIVGGAFSGSGYFGYTGDNSINLDGTGDYLAVADAANLSAGNGTTDTAFSVEAWSNLDTVTLGAFASKWSETANAREWLFSPAADGSITFKLWDESADGYIATTTATGVVTSGSWNYYVATYDGSETAAGLKIYKNGTLVSSTPATSSYTAMEDLATPVWLGAYESAGSGIEELDGKLDSILYWNKELSASEVLNSYNNAIGSGVGNIFDTQSTFTSSAAKLLSIRNNTTERMYVGLNLIGFTGDADKTIQVDRTSTASTAGYDLTLKAGGAKASGTDLAGGDVFLISGLSTGTGSSNIYLQTSGGGTTGTADNSLVSRLIIGGDGSVRVADNTELRFYDSTYYVGFTAPTLSANKIWTLPTGDGTAGQVLKTDGSGILSWTNRLDMTRTAVAAATYNAANSESYLGVTYTTTGAVTITLPAATSEKVFVIKDEGGNAGTNNITINRSGGAYIDGNPNTSLVISTNYGSVRLYSNGTDWFTY